MTKSIDELQAELDQVRELFLAAVATRVDGSKFACRYEEIQRELTARGHLPN
jgi:hypothetical protein